MRWFGLVFALAAVGCGGSTSVGSSTGACSPGPAAWDHTLATGLGRSVAVDPRTNDVLLVTEGPNGGNSAVTRMSDSGQELWRRSRPGAQRVAFGGNGDAFVSGSFTGSLGWSDAALTTKLSSAGFVARIDDKGGVIWAHKLEATGGGLTATALASDGDGRSIALFKYDYEFHEPNPPVIEGFLLVELDAAGHELWHKDVWGMSASVVGTDVAFDPGGNVVVSAHVNQGSVDFGLGPVSSENSMTSLVVEFGLDGAPRYNRTLGANTMALSVACDGAGNVQVAGDLRHAGVQYTTKPFLTEVAPDGTVGTTRTFDTGSQNQNELVTEGACGGLFVVTNSSGAAKVVRVSGTKAPETSTLSPPEWVDAAAVDRNGALVLTGSRGASGPQKAFVARWRP